MQERQPEPMSLLKKVFGVSSMVLTSRILGLVRDLMMTKILGAGAAADAFFVAFKLPNFFRRLFAEGAFSAGFVPLFSSALGKDITADSRLKADHMASAVLSWFLPVLILLLVVMEAAMVPVMLGLTGGYGDPGSDKFALTVMLGRLTFPYLVFVSLCAFLSAILNAYDKFRAAAFAPVLLNITLISAMVLAPSDQQSVARWLSAGVSLSGLFQCVWLWAMVKKLGVKIRLGRPRLSPEVKALWSLVLPAALGAGVVQLNLLMDVVLAARFLDDGAVSWLYYADRLNQLAVGIVGVAVGTVLLPQISRLIAADDRQGAVDAQNRGLELAMALTLPAAVALTMIAGPVITTLFERGAFTAADTDMTAIALMAYAGGLPAYVLVKILTPGFHGRKDTKTPVVISVVALLVNLGVNLALIGPLGHFGLAIGTALASWVNTALLFLVLTRRGDFALDGTALRRLFASLFAATGMGVGLWFGLKATTPDFLGPELDRMTALAALIAGGGGLYGLLLLLFGGIPLGTVRNWVVRRRA